MTCARPLRTGDLLLLVKKGDQRVAKLEAELRAERDGLQRRLADWDARENQLLEFLGRFREMHAMLAVVAELAAERALFAQQKLVRYRTIRVQ